MRSDLSRIGDKISAYLNNIYGEKAAEKYSEFIRKELSVYIRVNPLKISEEKLSKLLLENYGIKTEAIPNISNSLKIISGAQLAGKTIEHIIGLYYIQGLSSMLPPLILNPNENDVVLDLCSAPGSKTTELGAMMNNKGTLVANEIQLDRIKMLVHNLERMNLVNTGVLHFKGEYLSKIYADHFDKILVDAPCSGLGIIQKKVEVSSWWSLDRAERLGDLQTRLLIAAIKMVKHGGEIVYSTCTLTVEENELILDTILKKYPVELLDIELPVSSNEAMSSYNNSDLNLDIKKARRIVPWEINSDGFFIAKMKKTGDTSPPEAALIKQRDIKILTSEKKEINKNLLNIISDFGIPAEVLNEYKYIIKGNDIFFLNKNWHDENPGMFERIGTKFGTIDKNGITVLHTQGAQILQKYIHKRLYILNDKDELKKYLEGGTIKKDLDLPGQHVVKYHDYILGSAVNTKQGLKSRFPRSKRTQEILINF